MSQETQSKLSLSKLVLIGVIAACAIFFLATHGQSDPRIKSHIAATKPDTTCATFAQKRAVVEQALQDMSKLTTTNKGDASVSQAMFDLFADDVSIIDATGPQTCDPQKEPCLLAYASRVGEAFVTRDSVTNVQAEPHEVSGKVVAKGVEMQGSTPVALIGVFGVGGGCKIRTMRLDFDPSYKLSTMFDGADKNQDGRLNFQEFQHGVANHGSVPQSLLKTQRVQKILKASFDKARRDGQEEHPTELSKEALTRAFENNKHYRKFLRTSNMKRLLMNAYHGKKVPELEADWICSRGCCVWDKSSVRVRRDGKDLGLVRVDEVKIGDDVWAGDAYGWENVWHVILGETSEREMISIGFRVEGEPDGEISMTPKHLVFNGLGALVPAETLKIGDSLLASDGQRFGVVISLDRKMGTVRSLITGRGVLEVNGLQISSYSHSATFAWWLSRLARPLALMSKYGNEFVKSAVSSFADFVVPVFHPSNFHGSSSSKAVYLFNEYSL